MLVSIIIPAFNEEATVGKVIRRVSKIKIKGVKKEVIVVDDGSTDKTFLQIKNNSSSTIKIIRHDKNKGKGTAVRSGIKLAKGDFIIIQDADLEYDPKFIPALFSQIESKNDVVFGTRINRWPDFKRDERSIRFFSHYLGNRFLSLLTSLLYGQWLTDMETGYKLFPRKSVLRLKLNSKGFDFEPEITTKLLKTGYKIKEIPITTYPRSYSEGKKLNTLKDGLIALYSIIRYKFVD